MHNRIVYQIYPKSFMDTNHDGIGDVKGIIEKLDYLQDLGVNLLWLTPIFVSPQNDNGYDVADYRNIDPLFGTMADVETLIAQAKKRGIDIMFDMVLNHTSTAHTWFQNALKGQKEYQDYYIFKDKPTNWQSKFGGNAWEYVKDLDAYYLHLFDVSQADLNWENPKVFAEVCDIVNFWLAKGIKGLRFDVINLISKPEVYEDDLTGDGRRFYTDGPKVHQYLHQLNRTTFGQDPAVFTVGELSSTTIEHAVKYADPKRQELSSVFGFHHLKVDYKDNQKWQFQEPDFVAFKKILSDWQLAMQEHDALMALFLNNHDQPRALSRFGDDQNYPFETATLLMTLMFCMRGIPTLYQGEEIGLPNAYFNSIEQYRDIESLNFYRLSTLPEKEKLEILRQRSRDNGRTPMPWTNEKHYGFSTTEPWLGFSTHPQLKTVEENLRDEHSIYHYTKKLLKFRSRPTILKGTIRFEELDHPSRFVYHRDGAEKLIIIGNLSGKEDAYPFPKGHRILLSNYGRTTFELPLQPYEVLVLSKES